MTGDGRELERRLTRLETIQRAERERLAKLEGGLDEKADCDRVTTLEGDVGALREAAADLLVVVEVDRATRAEREKADAAARAKESKAERRVTKIAATILGLLVTVLEILRANGILG